MMPSLNAFARYLMSFAPWDVVGKSEIPCGCPVALWLQKLYPDVDVAVDLDSIVIGDEFDAPLWVFEVVRRIDASTDEPGDDITAGAVLAIVHEVRGVIGDENA